MLIRLPNHIRPWRHLVMFPLIQPEILCSIRFQDTFTSVWTSWKMCLWPPSLHHPHHALLSAGPSGSHTLCTIRIMHCCLRGPAAATLSAPSASCTVVCRAQWQPHLSESPPGSLSGLPLFVNPVACQLCKRKHRVKLLWCFNKPIKGLPTTC